MVQVKFRNGSEKVQERISEDPGKIRGRFREPLNLFVWAAHKDFAVLVILSFVLDCTYLTLTLTPWPGPELDKRTFNWISPPDSEYWESQTGSGARSVWLRPSTTPRLRLRCLRRHRRSRSRESGAVSKEWDFSGSQAGSPAPACQHRDNKVEIRISMRACQYNIS